ncbi:MAG: YihY/virulence factor BrkB family protein [Actinomycetia bacterium]|nr:YihY/virulence factor BrkB family protein [Actinomycetes bacterium]
MTARGRNLRGRVGSALGVLGEAATLFFEDRAKRLSAGLAYYALFALVPSLLLSVGVAGAFVGKEAAAGELADQMSGFLGEDAAEQIETAIASLWASTNRSSFAVFGVLAVVYSASVLFAAWRDSVELIWDVPYEPGLQRTLRTRAFAVMVPIGAGLLLAAMMLLQGLLTFVEGLVGSALLDVTLRSASALLQTVVAAVALGIVFRHSARGTRPAWRHVWPAVIMVVLVLNVGFWAYGVYLRFIGSSSVTGAASSAFLGLLVVYYTAQVLLFGVEVVHVLGRGDRHTPAAADGGSPRSPG